MKKSTSFCKVSLTLTVLLALAALPVRGDALRAQAPAPAPMIGAAAEGKATVLKDKVNVRSKPSKTAEVITQLNKGATLDVLERKTVTDGGKSMDWVRVQLPSTAKCYVSAKLVKNGVVTTDAVNIRSGPGTNFKEVGKLAKGEHVDVVEKSGDWLHIKPTKHSSGWVAAELVEVSAPEPVPAPPTAVITEPVTIPVVPPAPATLQVADSSPEMLTQYLVKEGVLKSIKDSQKSPAPFELMTDEVGGRQYRIAYLDTTEKSMAKYQGKRVRVFGNQRWHKGDRYPVITADRIDVCL